MQYEKPVKALIILSGLVVLASAILQIWSSQTVDQINSMSRDLNDAERPEKAYDAFIDHVVDANTTDTERSRIERKAEGDTLTSRLKFSGKMLLDIAIAGGYVFEALEGNASNTSKTGSYLAHCKIKDFRGSRCGTQKNVPVATLTAAGWMELGKTMGGLESLWENETAVKHFNNYIERAEYYDSRLRKGGFELKPVEMAFYTDRGLYMIGSLEENITIDNRTVDTQVKGNLLYADTDLDVGTYRIEADSQTFDLKIVPKIPDYGVSEDRFLIEGDQQYTRAILNGTKGVKTIELEPNKTSKVQYPSENYTQETRLSNLTRAKPFTVKLVSPEVNVTFHQGRQEGKPPTQQLYFYGMTEQEYRKTQQILERIRDRLMIWPRNKGLETSSSGSYRGLQ